MITEAIWEEKKYMKGSSTSAIKNFILSKYDVDESKLKSNMHNSIEKMLEETEDGWSLLKKSERNYKLTPEWRKEWTKQFGKKMPRRKRKKKPADYPKHPRNAYLFYSSDVRKKRQEDYPDKTFGELTTLIANEWKSLKSSKKKIYEEKAKKDRARYKRELKDWDAKHSGSESDSDSESKSRRKKRARSRRSDSASEESRSHSKRKRKRRNDSDSDESASDKKRKDSEKKSPLKKEKKNDESEEEKKNRVN